MNDDDETRPVRAVRRRIEEQETKLRPAVARRSTPQWLPPELATTDTARCAENRIDGYRFEPGALEATAPWRFFFNRWRFDFRDADGTLRFWFERGLKRLVLNQLSVFDANDVLLGRFEQQLTALELRYDVFDAEGRPRFQLHQEAEMYGEYRARRDGIEVGRIASARLNLLASLDRMITGRDEMTLEFNGAAEPLDRVLLIAGAVFMDRIYSTNLKR